MLRMLGTEHAERKEPCPCRSCFLDQRLRPYKSAFLSDALCGLPQLPHSPGLSNSEACQLFKPSRDRSVQKRLTNCTPVAAGQPFEPSSPKSPKVCRQGCSNFIATFDSSRVGGGGGGPCERSELYAEAGRPEAAPQATLAGRARVSCVL
jgi:hypothetical protein